MEEWVIYDDNDDRRNAQMVWDAQRRAWVARPAAGGRQPAGRREVYAQPAYPPAPAPVYAQAPAPVVYQQPAPPPAIAATGNFRIGVLADTAAQILAAVQPLPQPPRADADNGYTLADVIEYNEALAQTWQRNMQLKTLGAIARAFLP